MKLITVCLLLLLLVACTGRRVEEFAFRKALEHKLVELCGEDDKDCIGAVKSQIKPCMEKSDWRTYLENQDDEVEFNRFIAEFYSCIVDAEGNPYFEPNI